MRRMLLVYEPDRAGRMPDRIAATARGAEAIGATAEPRAFADAAIGDVERADVLVFGIDGRQAGLPRAVKRWLDALGFSGWRAFREKSGCVLAVEGGVPLERASAVSTVARILDARGLHTTTADDFGIDGSQDERAAAEALGRALAAAVAARPLPRRHGAGAGRGPAEGPAPAAG